MATIHTGGQPGGLRFAAGSVWVGSNRGQEIYRIDPATNRVTTVQVGRDSPTWLEATDTAVWAASGPTNTVVRLDPATNRVTADIPVGTFPVDGVVGPDGLVWIPNQGDNSVSRIDPATNKVVDTVKVGPLPFVARPGFGDMWVSNFGGFAVWRLRAG